MNSRNFVSLVYFHLQVKIKRKKICRVSSAVVLLITKTGIMRLLNYREWNTEIKKMAESERSGNS